ncbi:NHL repeat-containing protein [Rubripirellula reticaptiva]|uniref:PEP-CTERM protein-sorting domain-containing protein n=1 Tax=Rubripirellula reticaptiva TaxID=2528013 RepID=A0A5C6EGT4_9BACT|nr:hypothetical protein [Rubripirellula reticaptiva]TWU47750.1 hypothetical protein Poly59_45910 [Rubripirellula reticaptiva]
MSRQFCIAGALSFAFLLSVAPAQLGAAIVTPGNVLVMDVNTNTLREFTSAGLFIQAFTVADDAGAGSTEVPRDIAVDTLGNIHVFNGTFNPSLSTIDQATGVQTDRSGPGTGFAIGNVLNRGTVAAIGAQVFVADQPVGARNEQGILRFDAASGFTSTRFATDFIANDLNFGFDGRLYALGTESTSATSSPTVLNVYDPNTLLRLDQINLPTATSGLSLNGLVADGLGNYFAVHGNDEILKLDAAGNIVSTANIIDATGLYDIDIDASGNLMVSGIDNQVFFTNTSFSTQFAFDASTSGPSPPPRLFAAFATAVVAVPEPTTMAVLSVFAATVLCKRRRVATRRSRR